MDCLFCNIINKQIPSEFLYQTDSFIVIKDIHPQAPVHLLVIPKTHYGEFIEMPDDLLAELMKFAKSIIQKEHILSYRLVNNGKGAAFVDHFHLHILGRIDKMRSL